MEARREQRFPGQRHYVLSILPRLSTSASSYLQGEKHESGRPLEHKRSETKQTAMLQNGHVVGITWRELITNGSRAEKLARCVESPFLLLTHFSREFGI